MIAMRGLSGLPQLSSISRGRAPVRSGPPDRGDQWIAFVEILAGGHSDLGAEPLGLLANRLLELGGTEVAGRRVDEVADERRRLGKPDGRIDPCRFGGEQHARSAFRFVLLRAIGVEAMLGEQPAERGRTGIALRKLVLPFGQALAELGQAPGRELARIGHRRDDFELFAFARQDDVGVTGLPVEALRLHQGAILGRAGFRPILEARLVDEVDRMGFLAAVGDEQGREVGHWSDALASCSTG